MYCLLDTTTTVLGSSIATQAVGLIMWCVILTPNFLAMCHMGETLGTPLYDEIRSYRS